jgi:uncharacterized protein YqgC (DUF456 family)
LLAYLGWGLFWIVLAAALPVQVIGLPGTWIIVADCLALRLLGGPDSITTPAVLLMAVLAAGGEVLEFTVSAAGARSEEPVRGTVTAAIVGGIVGGVIGAPFFLGVGAIPGMALGAFTAVTIVNLAAGKAPSDAARSGLGAMTGRLKGTAAKIIVAAVMVMTTVLLILSS